MLSFSKLNFVANCLGGQVLTRSVRSNHRAGQGRDLKKEAFMNLSNRFHICATLAMAILQRAVCTKNTWAFGNLSPESYLIPLILDFDNPKCWSPRCFKVDMGLGYLFWYVISTTKNGQKISIPSLPYPLSTLSPFDNLLSPKVGSFVYGRAAPTSI